MKRIPNLSPSALKPGVFTTSKEGDKVGGFHPPHALLMVLPPLPPLSPIPHPPPPTQPAQCTPMSLPLGQTCPPRRAL